jgi:hypothetical protein
MQNSAVLKGINAGVAESNLLGGGNLFREITITFYLLTNHYIDTFGALPWVTSHADKVFWA